MLVGRVMLMDLDLLLGMELVLPDKEMIIALPALLTYLTVTSTMIPARM